MLWQTHRRPPAGAGSVVNKCGGGWSAVPAVESPRCGWLRAATAHRDTSVSELCRELGIRPLTLYRYVGPQGQLREQRQPSPGVGWSPARRPGGPGRRLGTDRGSGSRGRRPPITNRTCRVSPSTSQPLAVGRGRRRPPTQYAHRERQPPPNNP